MAIELFFMDSKGDVRRVFLACVLHAWGTNPAAVRVFRKRFPKAMWRDHWRAISRAIELLFFMDSKGNVRRVFLACVLHALRLESCWRSGVSELCLQGTFANGFAWLVLFFMDSKGNVRRVCLACVLHAWGTNPAAVRVFRKRFPEAMWGDKELGLKSSLGHTNNKFAKRFEQDGKVPIPYHYEMDRSQQGRFRKTKLSQQTSLSRSQKSERSRVHSRACFILGNASFGSVEAATISYGDFEERLKWRKSEAKATGHFQSALLWERREASVCHTPSDKLEGHCELLLKSMYGTRDAANIWQRDYTELLLQHGFSRNAAWPSVFYNKQMDIRLLVHSDDFVALADDAGQTYLQDVLQKKYELRVDGSIGYGEQRQEFTVLNRVVSFCEKTGTITYEPDLRHAEMVLEQLDLEKCKPVKTPGEKQSAQDVATRMSLPPVPPDRVSFYRSLVMRIAFLSQDRPDLSEATKCLARRMAGPNERYLRGTTRMVQKFHPQKFCQQLQCMLIQTLRDA